VTAKKPADKYLEYFSKENELTYTATLRRVIEPEPIPTYSGLSTIY
jgi:hypothetical protein